MTTPGDMSMTAPQPSPGVREAKLMLRSLWKESDASDELVPMLYGSPGSGRLSLIREVAQELEFERVVMIRTPELAPEDVTGFALPHADGPSRFHPSAESLRLTREWHEEKKGGFERLKAEGKAEGEYTMPGPVVLCLDDVPNAALALQETSLSPIFDRQLGDSGCTLPDNVKIILTGAREGVRLEMVDRYGFLRELNRPALQQEEAVTEGRSVRCR